MNDKVNYTLSGTELFNTRYNNLKLIDPVLPKRGLASLIGSPDVGKSILARQMALSIIFNHGDFLGYPINSEAKKIIYLSAKDDDVFIESSFKTQVNVLKKKNDIENLSNIKFLFIKDDFLSKLETEISLFKPNLVIIDSFLEIFKGDVNSYSEVHNFLTNLANLSKEESCLILFIHNISSVEKAAGYNTLGFLAFENKMDIIFELKKYGNFEDKRLFQIYKGQHISSELKKNTRVLKFDEKNLLFHSTISIYNEKLG